MRGSHPPPRRSGDPNRTAADPPPAGGQGCGPVRLPSLLVFCLAWWREASEGSAFDGGADAAD